MIRMIRWSYPRRQQYQRLRRAVVSGAGAVAAGALAVIAASAGILAVADVLLLVMLGVVIAAHRWLRLAGRSRVGARSEAEVRRALATLGAEGWRLRHSLPYGDVGTSTASRSRRPGSRSRSRPSAPRGALLYPRLSREELEGRFLGPMAYPDLKSERDSSMPLKRWSAEASGLGCRGTRVIWRKLDCLNPNLQTMQRSVCRKDACDRHHALRRPFSSAVATFGVWSVAQ